MFCIDGGGAKGWTMMPMYEALQESFGKNNQGEPLSNVFDLVAGTSAGGIAALSIHLHPKYGDATTMGRALLRPVLDESFSRQGVHRFLRTGHFYRDTRGSIYRNFFGSDTQLGRPSSIHADGDDGSSAIYNMIMEDDGDDGDVDNDEQKQQMLGPKAFVVATQKKIKEPSNSSLRSLFSKSPSFSSFKMTRSTSNLSRSSSNLTKSTTSKLTKTKSAMNLIRPASTKNFNRSSSSMSSSTTATTRKLTCFVRTKNRLAILAWNRSQEQVRSKCGRHSKPLRPLRSFGAGLKQGVNQSKNARMHLCVLPMDVWLPIILLVMHYKKQQCCFQVGHLDWSCRWD